MTQQQHAAATLLLLLAALSQAETNPEQMLVQGQYPAGDQLIAGGVQHSFADSAELLKALPGAAVNRNGGLTGLAQYRGMYGNRVGITINGVSIVSGGPNTMDSPLSYIPQAQLQALELTRGLASVAQGQETIGGYINANSATGSFATSDEFALQGSFQSNWNSHNNGSSSHLQIGAANNRHQLGASIDIDHADDSEFDHGKEMAATSYDRKRYDVFYAFAGADSSASIRWGINRTDDSGTPALPMDIIVIDSDLVSVKFDSQLGNVGLSYRASYSDVFHRMDNVSLRQPSMMRRNNDASAQQWFHKLALTLPVSVGEIVSGVDYSSARHQSLVTDPSNEQFFVRNFNRSERRLRGLFAQWEHQQQSWYWQLGARVNEVEMRSGEVANHNNSMLAMVFNQSDRSVTDSNTDLVAKLNYTVDERLVLNAGLGRKSRAPSYQERYLWMPMQATGGLADGRTYIGNINLNSEQSDEATLGFDYRSTELAVSLHGFYRRVDDYIQGLPTANAMALMMNSSTLEFSNVDARLYGGELNYRLELADSWAVDGGINYVRGERRDSRDNLYRLAPLNGRLALTYSRDSWQGIVSGEMVAKQHRVATVNGEKKTAGYGLVHVKWLWTPSGKLNIHAGVNNVFDRRYQDHLAGYNNARGGDVEVGERQYGSGRSVNAGVSYHF